MNNEELSEEENYDFEEGESDGEYDHN